jgi:hypothetical protein
VELYEWDRAKNQANVTKHGVDFTLMQEFDWDTAMVAYDDAHEEPRWVGQGFIRGVLHVVVFVERNRKLRIISLRAASARERRNHEQRQTAS